MFLLDTHVWLWGLEHEKGRLGRRTLTLLERWAGQDALRISPLSVFEVVTLCTAGRLRLSRPVEQWVNAALAADGTRVAPLSVEAVVDAGVISAAHLADSIDRLLVATARQMGATLVTRDRRILQYADETSAVRVHDAAR